MDPIWGPLLKNIEARDLKNGTPFFKLASNFQFLGTRRVEMVQLSAPSGAGGRVSSGYQSR